MTISYNWLCEYLPVQLEPERLSKILTAIGLEVESLTRYEEVKGGLQGLLIGEVLTCEQHPNADKLKLTTVNVGSGQPLQIVCGAANVAAGQKVVVAPVGCTIYPTEGDAITLKKAKIRGVESEGMICAEDEIGLGTSHEGIMVLDPDAQPGMAAADYFRPYTDWVFEIGLTPNRMDAMSHLGVARDVCAYLSYHEKGHYQVKLPFTGTLKPDHVTLPIKITIENTEACQRYAGVSIANVTIKESPAWLQQKLKSIGVRPINNVVDITNFILHETGQPLHAFDADAISGGEVIVKTLPEGTAFITLDEKERKLSADDLMICNSQEPMCIGGVFGGLKSGVKSTTRHIFLESAWFHPRYIRRTSLRHNLRTDAASRFEKGVDISNCVQVLKRAALLIKELAGGEIASEITDVYPHPKEKPEIAVKYHYLKKLSGKNYHPDSIKKILESLGFEWIKESLDEFRIAVPLSKPDVTLPADVVEEIMRIDGLDNIDIPETITLSPAHETTGADTAYREKISHYLTGLGFHEIFTNSIANSAWYDDAQLSKAVKMLNNLSAELDILRPSMLETGLQCIAFNLNRKNNDLKLFEFGKTYSTSGIGKYEEAEHLCLYITGHWQQASWKQPAVDSDFFHAKGLVTVVMQQLGLNHGKWTEAPRNELTDTLVYSINGTHVVVVGKAGKSKMKLFDIKQPVFVVDFNWQALMRLCLQQKVQYREIPRFPAVERDLAIVIDKTIPYSRVEAAVSAANVKRLEEVSLFDVFESEKLGADKKSLALHFVFRNEEKTLTDAEAEKMMQTLIKALENQINAEIRK